MSMAITLWIRDTSLRLHDENMKITRETMNKMGASSGVYTVEAEDDYGWKQKVAGKKESLTWLI